MRRRPKRLQALLDALDTDLTAVGRIAVVAADQAEIEATALTLVRTKGIRAMDAWHLAVASRVVAGRVAKGEPVGFATRDAEQARVAVSLGLVPR